MGLAPINTALLRGATQWEICRMKYNDSDGGINQGKLESGHDLRTEMAMSDYFPCGLSPG